MSNTLNDAANDIMNGVHAGAGAAQDAVNSLESTANEAAGDALEAGMDSITGRGLAAGIHALAGDVDAAKGILQDLEALHLERLSEGGYVDPSVFWPAYAALGELDSAFAWLQEGVKAGSWATVYLGVSPWADPLRNDPRYQTALDQIGLGHLKARFDSLAAAPPYGGT